ncbi:MAG: hypothetical protein HOE30_26470 [Deltaproteobacteria bacterium]|jgi:hypothetical protein|nr:hypothetical protein [Deltaproteobacteria bacterium]MBT4266126.1 hypothetical protein [Deltaproteobacteria bacterium]MBT4639611.1 hypothetical protein [Deltaproteobacteria bacterium]MBT6504905.1 hypothetical protein [Deltaproteobacteria bacterium]MBT6612583.1 hypothetical protein [Deltaproteobacteria bacterium]
MKTRVNPFLTAVLSCLIFLAACADAETDQIKLKVLSYGGNFTGSYSVDSAADLSFIGVSIGNEAFSYEKEVDVEDQLEINASPDATGDGAPESLEIKVYRDNSLIKTVQDTSIPVEKITLTYTSGESANSI